MQADPTIGLMILTFTPTPFKPFIIMGVLGFALF